MVREVIETIRPDQPFDAMRSVRVIVSPDLMDSENIKVQDKNVTIEENGLTVVTPDTGYQGLGEVQITTNVPEKRLQSKTVSINSNGFEQVYPDTGYQGLSYVTVNTNVPSVVNNQNKSVTIENNGFQQVLPDTGYSGIGELNLTVDVPQPSIQENDIRYIVPSNEARQIIVEPGSGFDALEKVTLNIASATLVTDQNILDITSNGTYNLPSLSNSQALGFADSCTVKVNGDINKTSFRYLSFANGNNISPAAIVDLESDTFTGSTTNDVNIELPEGRGLCIITVVSGMASNVQFVGNPTGTGDTSYITVSKNKYYKEVNYDIGSRVYLLNGEKKAIISFGTHNVKDKIFLETDKIDFNLNYIYSSRVSFNVV